MAQGPTILAVVVSAGPLDIICFPFACLFAFQFGLKYCRLKPISMVLSRNVSLFYIRVYI